MSGIHGQVGLRSWTWVTCTRQVVVHLLSHLGAAIRGCKQPNKDRHTSVTIGVVGRIEKLLLLLLHNVKNNYISPHPVTFGAASRVKSTRPALNGIHCVSCALKDIIRASEETGSVHFLNWRD